jgi:hypothetical protein
MKQWMIWILLLRTLRIGGLFLNSKSAGHVSFTAAVCSIDDQTYPDGAIHPQNACLICRSAENAGGWSVNDRASCDNGTFCDGQDTCLAVRARYMPAILRRSSLQWDADQCDTAGDDDDNNDDDDDDDNNNNDDDDDDDDDTTPRATLTRLQPGMVHFHYYGDWAARRTNFPTDQAWAAANIELGISVRSTQIHHGLGGNMANEPRGRWLSWRVAHLFNTYETAGDAITPALGPSTSSLPKIRAI